MSCRRTLQKPSCIQLLSAVLCHVSPPGDHGFGESFEIVERWVVQDSCPRAKNARRVLLGTGSVDHVSGRLLAIREILPVDGRPFFVVLEIVREGIDDLNLRDCRSGEPRTACLKKSLLAWVSARQWFSLSLRKSIQLLGSRDHPCDVRL